MKNKIHPFFLWLMIALMILTVFLGFAACTALDQLEISRQKTEQEQINLQDLIEFHLMSDTMDNQTVSEEKPSQDHESEKEKTQQ